MPRQAISPLVIALAILGILAASTFIYFQIIRGMAPAEPEAPEAPEALPASPPPAAPIEPEIEIPELDASDEVVRLLAGKLSSHPQLAAWLAPEDLVRRFVAAVVNVANDESPRPQLGYLEPDGDFRVREREGELYVDPRTYARYNLITEVFTSLETAEGVRLFRSLKPLFDEAYRDLGYPSGDFDKPLAQAIDRLLATPIPAETVAIEQRVTRYRFADPELEALSPVQKHLLRMGPRNARQVQKKLRFMRTALSLDG